jgi:two-component system, cell cycle sensor histidine kinase and response regulator CckA
MNKQAPHGQSQALSQLERIVRQNMRIPGAEVRHPLLRDRTDRLLGVLECMHAWVSEFNNLGTMIFSSPQVEQILGFTVAESMADDCIEFHPADLHLVIETSRSVRETGKPATNQTRVRHKLGHWVWIENSVIGWTNEDGEYHSVVFSRDISDIKRAESMQKESEARYSVVSQMSVDLITEMDKDGRYQYVGHGAVEILGYTEAELIALEPWALIHPEDRERVRTQFDEQFVLPFDTNRPDRTLHTIQARFQHKDGCWLWFETQGVTYPRDQGAHYYLAVNRDVTERISAEAARRELEENMQRSQKLESLGVLAGGIAHDFNNLLTPIMGAAGLGLMELSKDSPVRARMKTIHRASKRAAALTNQMLTYAGQHPLRVEQVDLSSIVEDMHDLATSSVAGKTTIDLKLARNLPLVEGEAAQLSQVIMNLISNAAEALPEGKGRLSIRTGTISITGHSSKILFAETLPMGDHVYFEVSDSGCGMNKETVDRIFEPFFTTKFTGRGLGLSAVAGIVRGHRGGIRVESEPERGTTFQVILPALTDKATVPRPKASPPRTFQAHGTALVIDDDEAVLELAREVLHRAGMKVLTASDGHEGVKLFESHANTISIVLLDRTMPSLSGSDTFKAIHAIRRNAKVVLVSGYSEERVTAEIGSRSLAGFLKKPFGPEDLLTRVQEVLDTIP